MEYPALITLIALLEYQFFVYKTGFSRVKYGVEAPATSGHPQWERLFRIQQNTAEQLIIFIPALWLFALFVSPLYAGLIGLLFVVGRPIYYISYSRDPKTRGLGFVLGFLSQAMMLIGSTIAVGMRLLGI